MLKFVFLLERPNYPGIFKINVDIFSHNLTLRDSQKEIDKGTDGFDIMTIKRENTYIHRLKCNFLK